MLLSGGESHVRGRVLWYRPADGRGLLASDEGAEFPFALPSDAETLQGGDLVAFEFLPVAPSRVAAVRFTPED